MNISACVSNLYYVTPAKVGNPEPVDTKLDSYLRRNDTGDSDKNGNAIVTPVKTGVQKLIDIKPGSLLRGNDESKETILHYLLKALTTLPQTEPLSFHNATINPDQSLRTEGGN